MKSKVFFSFAVLAVISAVVASALSSPDLDIDSGGFSESPMKTSPVGDNSGAAGDASQRAFIRIFADLAPRQKVMGIVNAIALLRTKISLIEEMRTAFEPLAGGTTGGPQLGHWLPGPALAYGDCRLGILGFEVCRHLGFLESDPMVAPSSIQSKMLTLVGASSLVASLKSGQLYLKGDADLNSILGPELLDSAVRALRACWSAQLLFPAFDARPAKAELMKEAMYHADTFLFLTAMHAKHILRFSRSDYEDVGSWLASIFSDLPATDTVSSASTRRGDKSLRMAEGADVNSTRPQEETASTDKGLLGKALKVAESVDGKSPRPQDETQSPDRGLLGGLLNRLFPTQSQQPLHSQDTELASAAPTNVLSALASSVGDITSMVTSTAQNAVKVMNGDASSDDGGESAVQEDTQKRLGGILNMIPEEVDGQF